MKNRLKALLLATGLTLSLLGSSCYAAEKEAATEAVTEVQTEKATEAQTEEKAEEATEAKTEEATEAQTEAATEATTEAAAEAATEAATEAAVPEYTVTGDGTNASQYDAMVQSVPQTLEAFSKMEDEAIDTYIETYAESMPSVSSALESWKANKADLGTYEDFTDITLDETEGIIVIEGNGQYSDLEEGTTCTITYTIDMNNNDAALKFDVKDSFGKTMEKAAMNTLMGICIVFLMLLFLSVLISQIHWIPDIIEGKNKKKAAAAEAAKPAVVETPAPVVEEEEDLTDDLELVAVIAAAIAASENTSADGFVVRSIRKVNRRKWQNA